MRDVCIKHDAAPNRCGGNGMSLCSPVNACDQEFEDVCMHRLPLPCVQHARMQEDTTCLDAPDMEAGTPLHLYQCEIASADVDMWMEFMADNGNFSSCARREYLEQLDCIWGVNPGIPITNVRPLQRSRMCFVL